MWAEKGRKYTQFIRMYSTYLHLHKYVVTYMTVYSNLKSVYVSIVLAEVKDVQRT